MPDFTGKTPKKSLTKADEKLSITFVPAGYLVEDFAERCLNSPAAGRTYALRTAVTVTVDPAPAGETVEPY